ncbi:MAG: TetR/AcrR family transcriptional regulator [Acidobacteriota bacterium]
MAAKRKRLTRYDWIRAALSALGERGLAGIAVEPLAKQLGVTKGSFYWHFKDVDALIDAALERWAVEETRESIARLEGIGDPRERLRTLMKPSPASALIGSIDLALATSASDPRVAKWLRQHHRLWIEFAGRAYRQMGYRDPQASYRATLAYTAWLGFVSLVSADPSWLQGERSRRSYIALARDLLVPSTEGQSGKH